MESFLMIVLSVIISSLLLSSVMMFIITTFPNSNQGNRTWSLATLFGAAGYSLPLLGGGQKPDYIGEMIFFTFIAAWGVGMLIGSMQIVQRPIPSGKPLWIIFCVIASMWLTGLVWPENSYFSWIFSLYAAAILLFMAWVFYCYRPVEGWSTQLLMVALVLSGLLMLTYPTTRDTEFAPFGFLIGGSLMLLTYIALNSIALIQFKNRAEAVKVAAQAFALRDPLTGLSNRLFLEKHYQDAVDRYKEGRQSGFVLLFVDLDRFKQINDNFGHRVGDTVLREIAKRLHQVIADQGTIARLGGDEFVIVLGDIPTSDAKILQVSIHNIMEAIIAPIVFENKEYEVGASIGCSHFPSDGHDLEELIALADGGMYEEKRKKKRDR